MFFQFQLVLEGVTDSAANLVVAMRIMYDAYANSGFFTLIRDDDGKIENTPETFCAFYDIRINAENT